MNPRRALQVLIGIEQPSPDGWGLIRAIDNLGCHLHHDLGDVCDIQLLVPKGNGSLISQFEVWGIRVRAVEPAFVNEGIGPEIDDPSLRQAIATAREQDCDYIVVPDEFLSYIDVIERQFHMRLGDLSFLLRLIEIFVRGFGVAWSFENPVFNDSFNHLYFAELQETVAEGFLLMNRLTGKGQDSSTVETVRSLFFNRLPHVCYSRDQLLFYLLQREAELRSGANRQPFAFELNYHLNFHYILVYGALDHAAMVVNEVCQLGLSPKQVGATYESFQKKLKASFPELYGIFSSSETAKIVARLGQLRHLTAHRGSINPATLVQIPDREATNEELDAYLSEIGQDPRLLDFAGVPDTQELLLEIQRSFAKRELLERNALDSDIVPVEIDGKCAYVRPFEDVTWPYRATLNILRQIIRECLNHSILPSA